MNINLLNRFLDFKTGYFLSISDLYRIFNLVNNLSLASYFAVGNIRVVNVLNANFNEFILF